MPRNVVAPEMLQRRIDCAMGRRPCELRLTNVRMIDVVNGEVVDNAEIFIDNGVIVDAGCECRATACQSIDLKGAYAAPGLIDAHVHIESSMLTPVRFARLIAPFGTTTIIADPHEIANVAGIEGIRFMMREAQRAEITMYFMLSSCVPATPFETSGAVLKAEDLVELIDDERVLGLAELMNVPGVLACDADLLKKAAMTLSAGKRIDGHSPLAAGAALSAYACAGVRSDHECSTAQELTQRLQRGFVVQMREGSAGQNVSALARAVTPKNSRFLCLCTDDASPDDVFAKGHVNNVVRKAVACGIDPIEAVRMATVNAAQHYGLAAKGIIAPGFDADLVVFDNLTDFNVLHAFAKGRLIAQSERMTTSEPPAADALQKGAVTGRVNIGQINKQSFTLRTRSGKARVIGLVPGDLVTRHLICDVPTDKDGVIDCRQQPGLLKIAVIERHHGSGRIGLGLVKGFVEEGRAFEGAIASTVAHDSHNIVVLGDNDADMISAVAELKRMQGGLALVRNGQVVSNLPLEIAGLMTDADAKGTALRKQSFIAAAHEKFGVPQNLHPVMAMSFLPLAVFAHLRVTDHGLFDSAAFKTVDIDPTA